jgi:hypothetical protein
MSASYNSRRAKVISERARQRAIRGWEVRRARMAETPRDPEPRKLDAGEFLGILRWHDASGEVRQIRVRQGARANQVRIDGMKRDHGWDYVLGRLRSKLAVQRRVMA